MASGEGLPVAICLEPPGPAPVKREPRAEDHICVDGVPVKADPGKSELRRYFEKHDHYRHCFADAPGEAEYVAVDAIKCLIQACFAPTTWGDIAVGVANEIAAIQSECNARFVAICFDDIAMVPEAKGDTQGARDSQRELEHDDVAAAESVDWFDPDLFTKPVTPNILQCLLKYRHTVRRPLTSWIVRQLTSGETRIPWVQPLSISKTHPHIIVVFVGNSDKEEEVAHRPIRCIWNAKTPQQATPGQEREEAEVEEQENQASKFLRGYKAAFKGASSIGTTQDPEELAASAAWIDTKPHSTIMEEPFNAGEGEIQMFWVIQSLLFAGHIKEGASVQVRSRDTDVMLLSLVWMENICETRKRLGRPPIELSWVYEWYGKTPRTSYMDVSEFTRTLFTKTHFSRTHRPAQILLSAFLIAGSDYTFGWFGLTHSKIFELVNKFYLLNNSDPGMLLSDLGYHMFCKSMLESTKNAHSNKETKLSGIPLNKICLARSRQARMARSYFNAAGFPDVEYLANSKCSLAFLQDSAGFTLEEDPASLSPSSSAAKPIAVEEEEEEEAEAAPKMRLRRLGWCNP